LRDGRRERRRGCAEGPADPAHPPEIFSYGITDNAGANISLYKPGVKDGILVTGKPGTTLLPPPFDKEVTIGIGTSGDHKFIVCDFNTPEAIVCAEAPTWRWAASSKMGTTSSISRIRTSPRSSPSRPWPSSIISISATRTVKSPGPRCGSKRRRKEEGKPAVQHEAAKTAGPVKASPLQLFGNDSWALRYFDSNDLHFTDRQLFS